LRANQVASRHPVRALLRQAAYAGKRRLPTEAELDKLGLPGEIRSRVKQACREVAAVHDEGAHQDAWDDGDQHAAQIIDGLRGELRDPDHWRAPDPLADVDDPAELAAAVWRRF
jgi:hypothetical protein